MKIDLYYIDLREEYIMEATSDYNISKELNGCVKKSV